MRTLSKELPGRQRSLMGRRLMGADDDEQIPMILKAEQI